MKRIMKRILLGVLVATVSGASRGTAAPAQPKKPVSPANVVKGQTQTAGGDGVFGTVYTLNDGINFAILKARYSIEPYNSYDTQIAHSDEKFLILTVAIKNANPEDAFFGGETFDVVDDKEQKYAGSNYRLASKGTDSFAPNLKPGQGIGQRPDEDELTVAIKVPAKARISKIILNRGRKALPKEEVIRYFIASVAEKARDGQDGNPRNIISPLSEALRDPADKQGATALEQGIAKLGVPVPTGYFTMSCDAVTTSTTEKVEGNAPADGKQFCIATMTVKNLYGHEITLFEAGADALPVLKDTDGEKYKIVPDSGLRKAKRDEQADSNFKMATGESYSFRYFFEIPKDAKPKTLVFGQNGAQAYVLDLTGAR